MTPYHVLPSNLRKQLERLATAIFVLAIGWLANQFWLIPIQQARQDSAIRVLIERLDRDEETMKSFSTQHVAMIREVDATNHKLDDLRQTIEDHERRSRLRSARQAH